MFTGIIEATAKVLDHSGRSLVLERPRAFGDIKLGSSIAVSGVCLSASKLDETSITFDVMPITLEKTTLGSLQKNDRVNVERAMKADGRFEGHVVQGHVDGVGIVSSMIQKGDDVRIVIDVPDELMKFVVPRGSITLDGVALTVSGIEGSSITVGLIPMTLEMTTLGERKEGDSVNVEMDILGKYMLNHHNRA